MIGIEGTPPYVATFEDAAVPVSETKQTYQQLEQELEVWRNGPSCWNCGDSGDVHHLDGEWLGKCDCLAAKLIDVTAERDQLKAEIAPLRGSRQQADELLAAASFHVGPWSNELARKVILQDISGLRPSMAEARTKLDQATSDIFDLEEEREQLKAENEALRKDLESHKRMLLSSAVSIGAIGEALGAEMDDDPSELEELAAELRKNADRFLFINDCPIRTMVALSRKATDADFDLESECDRIMSKIASKKTGD